MRFPRRISKLLPRDFQKIHHEIFQKTLQDFSEKSSGSLQETLQVASTRFSKRLTRRLKPDFPWDSSGSLHEIFQETLQVASTRVSKNFLEGCNQIFHGTLQAASKRLSKQLAQDTPRDFLGCFYQIFQWTLQVASTRFSRWPSIFHKILTFIQNILQVDFSQNFPADSTFHGITPQYTFAIEKKK